MSIELLLVILFSLSLGSFINVIILRVPKGKSIILPNSHCVKCNHSLSWYENIPIISFVFLRGRCKKCKVPISYQYPIIEFLTLSLGVILYIKLAFSIELLVYTIIFALLLSLSMIDIHYHAVPDSINLLILTIALIFAPNTFESIQSALYIAGALVLLRFYLSYILKKEAMGEGDIILGATMGAVVGVKFAFIALFLSSLIALPLALYMLIRYRVKELAFIPFLAFALLIVYLYDNEIDKLLMS